MVCAWAPEEHSPDAMPERKLSGPGASEESVTAGVKLTDRYAAIRACAPVYLGVLLHGYIPD